MKERTEGKLQRGYCIAKDTAPAQTDLYMNRDTYVEAKTMINGAKVQRSVSLALTKSSSKPWYPKRANVTETQHQIDIQTEMRPRHNVVLLPSPPEHQ